MAQLGAFGRRVGEFLRLEETPPTLVTRSLRSTEISVTETRNDNPVPGLSGSLAIEDAYLVSLKLQDYPACENWMGGRCIQKVDVHAGSTWLYDLKCEPRYVIDKPFHGLHFYVPRSALDSLTEHSAARRIDQLNSEYEAHDDAIVRHIGASMREGLRRPDETNQLFIDHMMLALTAHVAQTYGDYRDDVERSRGGLAPWQVTRACEKLESELGGKISLQAVASELGLSVSHFSRAFRISTGLPPHQWLLHQRVRAAQQLMSVHERSLSDIAISSGFANQSHFTRVFSAIVGASPRAWRRDTYGDQGNKA